MKRQGILSRFGIVPALAAVALAGCGQSSDQPEGAAPSDAAAVSPEMEAEAAKSASEWLALADAHDWAASWAAASEAMREATSAADWAATATPMREPLGVVQSRELVRTMPRDSLPDGTKGDFLMLEYRTGFENVPGSAYETVILAGEDSGWKVAAYFIR